MPYVPNKRKITKNDRIFVIEYQWQQFINRMGLDESKCDPTEWRERKRMFFGAWVQCLLLLQLQVSELSEDDGVHVLEAMKKEGMDFWGIKT